MQPTCIAGKPDFEIDPTGDDFYKRLIDLRSMVKTRMRAAKGQEKEELDSEQEALKILANSTSYGIFVEVNVSDLDKYEKRECFGSSGVGFPVETDKNEEPGRYFHPLLATLIAAHRSRPQQSVYAITPILCPALRAAAGWRLDPGGRGFRND